MCSLAEGERGGDAQVVDPAHLNEGDVEVGEGGTVGIAWSWEAVGSGQGAGEGLRELQRDCKGAAEGLHRGRRGAAEGR